MPTVAELTSGYAGFMRAPQPGPGVCRACFNLTDGYNRCYACAQSPAWLDAVAPISYSVAHEQLHLALVAYKRAPASVARRFQLELAALLWRYLALHEHCVARAAGCAAPAVGGQPQFQVITTVPSSDRRRDTSHPLHSMVGELVEPVRDRFKRLLARTEKPVAPHSFDAERFAVTGPLTGGTVLLIDDTWTTGANAQSAAAALKAAGAERVAIVVIGRHVNREWGENDRRLRALAAPFAWDRCPRCRVPSTRVQALAPRRAAEPGHSAPAH